jgi:hypothetical protein
VAAAIAPTVGGAKGVAVAVGAAVAIAFPFMVMSSAR